MSAKNMLIAISIYQYLMLILASILFLIIPLIESRQYFDSRFVDIFVRSILWLYFVGSYWSIANAIKIKKRKNIVSEIPKNIVSFVLLSVRAAVTGVFLLLLTKWSLTAFAPQISSELSFIISLANGAIYAILVLSLYFFLPED